MKPDLSIVLMMCIGSGGCALEVEPNPEVAVSEQALTQCDTTHASIRDMTAYAIATEENDVTAVTVSGPPTNKLVWSGSSTSLLTVELVSDTVIDDECTAAAVEIQMKLPHTGSVGTDWGSIEIFRNNESEGPVSITGTTRGAWVNWVIDLPYNSGSFYPAWIEIVVKESFTNAVELRNLRLY